MMRNICLLLSVIATASCAMASYIEPQGSELANVRIAQPKSFNGVTLVRQFDDQECNGGRQWGVLFQPSISNSMVSPGAREVNRLQIPFWDYHKTGASEFRVAVEKPLHLMFASTVTGWNGVGTKTTTCGVILNEQLQARKSYEFRANWDFIARQCSIVVSEFSGTASAGGTKVSERVVTSNSWKVPPKCQETLRW